jgi:ribose/xylose/arabinose/galactoside ABC-type transport system permease subunit
MIENEVKATRKPHISREAARHLFRHGNSALFIILILLIAVFSIVTNGISIRTANISNILLQSSMRGIVSIGQLFVILTAGIDVSVGGLAGLCAAIGASLLTQGALNIVGAPVSLPIAIAIMLLLGLGVGTFSGYAVSRIGMMPLIVTLAVWLMTTGGVFKLTHGIEIAELPPSFAFFGQGIIAGVPVPVIIFIATAVAGYFVLYHTPFGHSVYAVGGNPTTTWLSGVNVPNTIFLVYVISGFLAGLTGLILASRNMSAGMFTAVGLEFDCIAAVVVGGVSLGGGSGTLIGTVIGVMIIGIINNGMNLVGLTVSLQRLVRGGIIFTAVAIDSIRRR